MTTPEIPDTEVPVNEHLLHKLERELQKPNTDWARLDMMLQSADLSPAQGYALVVPANYAGKSDLLAFLPKWAHLDAPGSTVRVTRT